MHVKIIYYAVTIQDLTDGKKNKNWKKEAKIRCVNRWVKKDSSGTFDSYNKSFFTNSKDLSRFPFCI